MSYETAYLVMNAAVMPAWLLLFFVPRATITARLIHSGAYPFAFAILYIVLLARGLFFGASADGADMSSIDGVMALFSHPNGILIGWAHYLAFDLFVGAWITRDGLARGMHRLALIPCQFFTLMFGPVGLFLYFLCRRFSHGDTTPAQA